MIKIFYLLTVFTLILTQKTYILNSASPFLEMTVGAGPAGTALITLRTDSPKWVAVGVGISKTFKGQTDWWVMQTNELLITRNISFVDAYGWPLIADLALGSTNDLTMNAWNHNNGIKTGAFTRRKTPNDIRDTTITRGWIYIVHWVEGESVNFGTLASSNNVVSKYGFTELEFDEENNYTFWVIHTVFYIFAWMICATLANFFVKFWLTNRKWASIVHTILYILCLAFSIVGFIIGIWMSRHHFNSSHKILGYFIMIGAILQPISGWLTYAHWVYMGTWVDWLRHPVFLKFHYWLGYITYIAAIIQCFTGLEVLFNVNHSYYVTFGVYCLLLIIIYLTYELGSQKVMFLVKDDKNGFRPVYLNRYHYGDLCHEICLAFKVPLGSVEKVMKLSSFGPTVVTNSKQIQNMRFAAKLLVHWKPDEHFHDPKQDALHDVHIDGHAPEVNMKKEEKTGLI